MSGDTTNDARAITPDGAFVVGISGPSGVGFLYNVTNGYIVQPFSGNDGNAAQSLSGVAYRIDTNQSPAQPQMVVSGLAGTPSAYTVWMTPDGGTNWDVNSYHYGGGKKNTLPLANGLASTS